jgi:two-component system, NtrC family, response regulator GlrR
VAKGSTLLLSDAQSGELLERRWSLEVIEGPDAGKSVVWRAGTYVVGTHEDADLMLTDPAVSRRHATFELFPEGVMVVDRGSRNGTFLASRRVERALVTPGGVVKLGKTRLKVTARDESIVIDSGGLRSFGDMITAHPTLAQTFSRLELVAKTDVTVLLEGEPGTGKRALAREIHARSERAREPLAVADCAREQPQAAVENARGGTVVLMDVSRLSADLQARVLELVEAPDRNVRLIVTERADLDARMRNGEMIEELYYRIAVVRARIPALRDRPEDLPELARHFAQKAGGDRASLSAAALRSLSLYDWPGNARELERVIERAVAFSGGREIGPDELLPEVLERGPRPFHEAKEEIILEFERRYVRALLFRNDGNVSGAARDAGLSRGAFYALMKRCGIEP